MKKWLFQEDGACVVLSVVIILALISVLAYVAYLGVHPHGVEECLR